MGSNTVKRSLATEMKGHYQPTHIRHVFNNSPWLKAFGSRDTYGGISQPYFYNSDHATVFPPVTDTDKKDMAQRETIQETLEKTADALRIKRILLDKTKRMVFPVTEEQPILLLFPRNHWVTLIYDPATQNATLIDSRPQIYGYFYPTSAMEASLVEGLKYLDLTVKHFEVKYQAIQHDDIHCGAWTAMNVEAFALGASIEQQMAALTSEDKETVIQHQIDLVCSDKEKMPYLLRDGNSTASATDSNASLNTLDSDDGFVQVPEECFPEKAVWIQTAIELFKDCFNNPRALILALIARENLTYNGIKLSDEHMGIINISTLFNEIEQKYPHFSHTQRLDYERKLTGYGLFNPSYIVSKLKAIGFTDADIHPMGLSDMIRYDAALCSAEANAGHDAAYARLQTQDEDEVLISKARAELHAFKHDLALALKHAVEQQQQRERLNAVDLDLIANHTPVGEDTATTHLFDETALIELILPIAPHSDESIVDTVSVDLEQGPLIIHSIDPLVSADFQLQCIQALLITGCVLLAISVLTCPPIAGILGIGGILATNTSITAASLGGASLLASAGLFAIYRTNQPTNTPPPESSVSILTSN